MKIKEVNRRRAAFYIIGFMVLVLYHMRYDLSYGDVVAQFGGILKRGSEYFPEDGDVFSAIVNFTLDRYAVWSSRNVIEAVLIIVGALPAIVWHILDIWMVLLAAYSLDGLLSIQNDKIKYLSMFSLLMMYRVIFMRSAGWIATTINYSWVVATGLYAFLVIQRIRKGEALSKVSYILALFAALFAMNHEQMCGMMILVLAAMAVVDIHGKKLRGMVIPFYVINFAELILILICPGNGCRKEMETRLYLPEYETYGLLDKGYEGVRALLQSLFGYYSMVILVLLFLLLYLAYKRHMFLGIKGVTAVPLFYIAVNTGFSLILRVMPQGDILEQLRALRENYRQSGGAVVVEAVMLLCILTALYVHIRFKDGHFLLWSVLAAAAATKLVLGFSVAFKMSGERTSIYLYFALIFVVLSLIGEYEETFSTLFHKKWFCLGLYGLNILLFVWNYRLVCGDIMI